MLNVFWNDIDTRDDAGIIYVDYYSLSNISSEVSNKLKSDADLAGIPGFEPKQVVVSTWVNVSRFPADVYKEVQVLKHVQITGSVYLRLLNVQSQCLIVKE